MCLVACYLVSCGGNRPSASSLTLLAPAAPGGGWDQTARAMQQALREENLVPAPQVENVPGAGGVIGLAKVVNDRKDDPNLIMITGLIMMGAVLTNDSPVSLEQVTPLARLIGEYEVLVVPAGSPHRTLAAFTTAWKLDPGGFAIAGGSAGGADHMLAGLVAREVGIDVATLNYVPHSGGGESLASLLGGHVAAGISGYAELKPFIDSGRLVPLAISSDERLLGIDIPTFVELGIDVSLANWRGLAAAPGISQDDRARLVSILDRLHASAAWQEALDRNNWIDLYATGDAYETFLAEESERVASVLASIGLVE